jgi:hypothetical protein
MQAIIPLEKMTDAQIECEAIRRTRSGEHEHASDLRAFARLRSRLGPDYSTWPFAEIEREGLRVNKAAFP